MAWVVRSSGYPRHILPNIPDGEELRFRDKESFLEFLHQDDCDELYYLALSDYINSVYTPMEMYERALTYAEIRASWQAVRRDFAREFDDTIEEGYDLVFGDYSIPWEFYDEEGGA